MRLFAAVNFTEDMKDALMSDIKRLKEHSLDGNFTGRDNLHLTVAFIGETSEIEKAKAALSEINADCFTLQINGFGRFSRRGGDIYWRGIQPNQELELIHQQVKKGLNSRGFALEERPFRPHLTLGRQVIAEENFDMQNFKRTLPRLKTEVKRVSLMQSSRIEGKLKYTEIYGVDLK